jgi:hypothetical protein
LDAYELLDGMFIRVSRIQIVVDAAPGLTNVMMLAHFGVY